MVERANATHELLLFLEHMPYTLQPWLEQHPEQLPRMLDELFATIGFLRNKGVIHFDAHFHNIVSEGTHAYLTDWGLCARSRFCTDASGATLLRNTY